MHLPLSRLRSRPTTAWWLGAAVTVVALMVIVPSVDTEVLRRSLGRAAAAPQSFLLALAAYAGAFLLRAVAWRRVLPRLPFGQALAAIHVALGGNHLLPLRLGEPLRVTSAVRRAGIPVADAAASTVTLRAADIAGLAVLALATAPAVVAELTGGWGWMLLPVGVAGVALGAVWLRRLGPERGLRLPGPVALLLTLTAWVLEAAVVHTVAGWAGVELGVLDAVAVTSVTVAAQTVAVAPGGFGTYEAAGTAAFVALGLDPATGLAIALTTHGVKTLYALLSGIVGALWPSPGLLGRLRVAAADRAPRRDPAAADAPVVLFMPAYEEAACIAEVVGRVPDRVLDRRVEFLVVDDGSTDATATLARGAGAEVVELGSNQGLGAAVRRGLAEGVARGAAAVVFCDADGEYAPEELERLVAPILADEADYVIGSRFSGEIERMLPHRRFGNLVLTLWVRFLSRRPVTDGQSGYRALSGAAARHAEVIHDFNYAQVLTLDLIAKGYRYAEVPISYHFRQTGDSFVRLGRYLRAVVPAVWRELNDRGEPWGAVAHSSSATSR